VEELVRKQASILASAAKLVRPGGRLVYATCSILPEENDAIVNDFLASHPEFGLRSAHGALTENRIELPRTGGEGELLLRLSPRIHGTDGFFAALLERAA